MNFGAFSTPEENIMFNVNDFDETLPGVDFTLDVKRLAASVAVAADAAQIAKSLARALAAGQSWPIANICLPLPGARRWRRGTATSISSRK